MAKDKVITQILRFSDNILIAELSKYKNINNRRIINKGKLLDYAVFKTFSPSSLEVLRADRDYNKFLKVVEKQDV
jgi:hypothetical protein